MKVIGLACEKWGQPGGKPKFWTGQGIPIPYLPHKRLWWWQTQPEEYGPRVRAHGAKIRANGRHQTVPYRIRAFVGRRARTAPPHQLHNRTTASRRRPENCTRSTTGDRLSKRAGWRRRSGRLERVKSAVTSVPTAESFFRQDESPLHGGKAITEGFRSHIFPFPSQPTPATWPPRRHCLLAKFAIVVDIVGRCGVAWWAAYCVRSPATA